MSYSEDIKKALITLRQGGVILYPTDTIWGLGCDATNFQAVERIFKIKKREEVKSLIILVNSYQMLERYVESIPDAAVNIIEVAVTPLTIVYPKGKNLAGNLSGADGSVGVRICHDDFCNELITRFSKPLVSSSANISGTPAPGNFIDIEEEIIRSVDYVVKHRQDDRKLKTPSSVIKVENDGGIVIIRH